MKFKLLKVTLAGIILLASTVANAGLIIGNQEFLELGATDGKTFSEVEALIAIDTSLSGYSVATNIDMAMIYNLIPGMSGQGIGNWNQLVYNSYTKETKDVLDFFVTGTYGNPVHTTNSFRSWDNKTITYNHQRWGLINYKDSITNEFASGHMNFLLLDGIASSVIVRAETDIYNLAEIHTSAGNNSNVIGPHQHHLFVRSVNVPEPSTLAIFALGMIGLASRRFKKQS